MGKRTKEAFVWIIKLLHTHKIPFQIFGGFAAKIYGSPRHLADIDIGMPDKKLKKLLPIVKKHVVYGPKIYNNGKIHLILMTLSYQGQEIDICGADTIKVIDKKTKKWLNHKINLVKSTEKKVYGINVPVIKLKDLVSWKSNTGRKEDIKDIKFISK